MRIAWALLAVAALPRIAAPQTAPAAQPQDSILVVTRLAIEHVSREWIKHPVMIDPRIGARGGMPPATSLPMPSPAFLAAIAIEGVATVATLEKALACSNPSAPGCKTNGRATFITISLPEFRGDSATLLMFVRSARDLTAAESASVREAHVRGEAQARALGRDPSTSMYDSTRGFARMGRPGGSSLRYTLIRIAGRWTVAEMRIMGQS